MAGNIVYQINTAKSNICDDEPCAGLEFKDEDGDSKIFYYTLSSLPAIDGYYRTQVQERERKVGGQWGTLEWLGETWRMYPDPTPDVRLGQYGWVSNWTLAIGYSVNMPGLTSSRLGFCFCPGDKDGLIDADLVATNVWNY
jgi:hypothetical protein